MAENKRSKMKKITSLYKNQEGKLRVAAYCRVSTDSDEQKGSFDSQVETYTRMIEANSQWQFAGIYADEGVTGTSAEKRPQFMKMIRDCDDGKVDLIITKSISRFARNIVECLTYVRHLNGIGVNIVFESSRIDTRQKYSEMLLTVLAAFAQEESRSISENTIWGIRKRFEEGVAKWTHLYGYEKKGDIEYIIVPEQAEIVRKIFNMYEQGMSLMEIRRQLESEGIPNANGRQEWSQVAVNSILMNERYAGDIMLQKYVTENHLTHKAVKNDFTEIPAFYIENHHDPIISRKQFERVQKIRSMKRNQHSRADEEMGYCNQYPLGRKLLCPRCGSVLYQRSVRVQSHGKPAWCCERGENACRSFIIRSDLVEKSLLKVYETVDMTEVMKRKADNATVAEASKLIDMKKEHPFFDKVDYWWVDELIDHIEFGKHTLSPREIMRRQILGTAEADDRVMKVFWRCGVITVVPSGVVSDRDDPSVLARMWTNLLRRREEKSA